MLTRARVRSRRDHADTARFVQAVLERLRRAREPLLLATVGLLYYIGTALEPARRIRNWVAGDLWQILFAVALAALVVVVIDDRRLRRRLRAQMVNRKQVDRSAGVVLEK